MESSAVDRCRDCGYHVSRVLALAGGDVVAITKVWLDEVEAPKDAEFVCDGCRKARERDHLDVTVGLSEYRIDDRTDSTKM